MLKANDVILFQGDSITDAGRSRQNVHGHGADALGHGYACLTAAKLLALKPALNLTILNRGISGNKVPQLAERWQVDCLDLKPTVVSILIGVNDTWHAKNNPALAVPLDVYENVYRDLIEKTRQALPGVRLVLCEPFVFKCGAVNDTWFPEIDQRRDIVAKLAHDHRCTFVAFQKALNDALPRQSRLEYWLGDGVHPTLAGHEVLSQAWLKAVR